ncbi:hypothetical protein [Clostridium sp. Marseille-Q2269]|uniref:hypothetical protein n=1 Tax=Clostridium sp. Marseille-Q2269 TaxID=2942205 RepID=UPI002073AF86|nr:hypothetical protein [Clostridium sp. Marseille-Q2269]
MEILLEKATDTDNIILAIDIALLLLNEAIEAFQYADDSNGDIGGLVTKWKEIRYTAYKELSMKEEQQKLAKELLLHGNFLYYRELKKLTTEGKEVFYNKLKQELKNFREWQQRNIYLKVIEEENDLDEIMEFVRKNPETIEKNAFLD